MLIPLCLAVKFHSTAAFLFILPLFSLYFFVLWKSSCLRLLFLPLRKPQPNLTNGLKKKKWSMCGTEEGMHGYTFLILLENQAKKIILLISLVAALLSLPILEWCSGSS